MASQVWLHQRYVFPWIKQDNMLNDCDFQGQTQLTKKQVTNQCWKDTLSSKYVAYASKEYCVFKEALKCDDQ